MDIINKIDQYLNEMGMAEMIGREAYYYMKKRDPNVTFKDFQTKYQKYIINKAIKNHQSPAVVMLAIKEIFQGKGHAG